MVTKEKDEELALFLEVRRREKDKERNSNNFLLLHSSDGLDASSTGANSGGGSPPMSKILMSMPIRKTAAEKFLDSENDKSDYDWLITPPGTPLFPSMEAEAQRTMTSQLGNARPTALKSRLTNILEQPASRINAVTKRTTVPSGLNSTTISNRKPSPSRGPASANRPATPTGRPTMSITAKASRPSTPTSRSTLPSTKAATAPGRSSTPTRTTARSSTPTARTAARSSTPTARTAARSSTPTARTTARSSTPTARSTARSSTPAARPSLPASKSVPRSATPTRQPPTALITPSVIAPSGRPSSVIKSVPTASKNAVPSRGSSPTVKSRPWKPDEMPGFSLDAPPNLRTSLPERPASASRGRPAGASAGSSSIESGSSLRRRQQSCSPTKGRASTGSASGSWSSIPVKSKTQTIGSDDVNPGLMGSKMVERVVNMRKLAPPKKDDPHSTYSNSSGKSSSLDSSGFGRSLSKKSLDMALRHMDIRRSVSGNIRSLVTNIPASSMYSVRSGGSSKTRTISVSDSPHATCSNASSEPSVNNNSFFADMIEIEDHDIGSERGNSSPVSRHEAACTMRQS